ncbi:MAG TPA: hypothetical protein VGM23_05905 [Armatimonadota bacterium]|jgi:hypothetical protein
MVETRAAVFIIIRRFVTTLSIITSTNTTICRTRRSVFLRLPCWLRQPNWRWRLRVLSHGVRPTLLKALRASPGTWYGIVFAAVGPLGRTHVVILRNGTSIVLIRSVTRIRVAIPSRSNSAARGPIFQ